MKLNLADHGIDIMWTTAILVVGISIIMVLTGRDKVVLYKGGVTISTYYNSNICNKVSEVLNNTELEKGGIPDFYCERKKN